MILDKGLRLQIVLTKICNNACSFCDIIKQYNQGTMKDDVLESIYTVMINHGNCTNITLTGGEAIMHPKFNEILLRLREINPNIHIQVNTNFQHNLFEQLPYDIIRNIDFLSITLHDQYVKDIDSFFEKVKNIKNIDDKQVTLMLSRESYKDVLNIYHKYNNQYNVILKYVYEDVDFLRSVGDSLILEAIHEL